MWAFPSWRCTPPPSSHATRGTPCLTWWIDWEAAPWAGTRSAPRDGADASDPVLQAVADVASPPAEGFVRRRDRGWRSPRPRDRLRAREERGPGRGGAGAELHRCGGL